MTATIPPGQMLIPGQTLWAGLTLDNNTGGTGATRLPKPRKPKRMPQPVWFRPFLINRPNP